MEPAIFIDRDKTLNLDLGYNPQLEVYDDVVDFLVEVNKINIKVIVISNQSGVSRGFFKNEDVKNFNSRLQNEVLFAKHQQAKIHDFYWCKHTSDAFCCCRKPNPGLIYKAAIEHNINLNKSIMIGDKLADYNVGENANVHSLLINRDNRDIDLEDKSRIIVTLMDALPIINKICKD